MHACITRLWCTVCEVPTLFIGVLLHVVCARPAGMRMSIKRCPLTQLPDVSWEVADWQQSVVHPTYDITSRLTSTHDLLKATLDCTDLSLVLLCNMNASIQVS
jgi:hypothetical protein